MVTLFSGYTTMHPLLQRVSLSPAIVKSLMQRSLAYEKDYQRAKLDRFINDTHNADLVRQLNMCLDSSIGLQWVDYLITSVILEILS